MLHILCQISLPWQRGLIVRPQQPPTRYKDLDDIPQIPIQIEL